MGKRVRIREDDMLFYLAYVLYFVPRYMEYLALRMAGASTVITVVKIISYVLCVAVILLNVKKITIPRWDKALLYGVIGIVVLYQVIAHSANSIFVVLLFSVAFVKRDMNRFFAVNFKLHVVLYAFTVLSSFIGVTENVARDTYKYGVLFMRMSLGFNYPGQLLISLMPIVFLYYYLYRDRISWKHTVFWVACIAVIFIFSQTIMPTALLLLFIGVFHIQKRYVPRKRKILQPYLAPVISCALTVLLLFMRMWNFGPAVLIDNASNYRFSLGATAYSKFGITLLGSGFQNISNENQYLILDSEYMFMLISNGIIYTALAALMYAWAIKWAQMRGYRTMVLVFVLLAINGIFNNGIFNLIFNPFIIVLYQAMDYSPKRAFGCGTLEGPKYSQSKKGEVQDFAMNKEGTVKKNKVCVVSWFGGTNYGTNLQIYALTRQLERMGFTAAVKGSITGNINYITHPFFVLRRVCHRLGRFFQRKAKKLPFEERYAEALKAREANFDSFCSGKLKKLDSRGKEEWDAICREYQAFVTGSDQVWNPNYFQGAMMLDFIHDDRIRKISYAPSIGVTELPNRYRRLYRKLLRDYHAVSVREESAAALLRDISPVPVKTVVDPTMLLPQEEWDFLAREAKVPDKWNAQKPYLLCYFVGDRADYWDYVKRIQDAAGFHVIVIPLGKKAFETGFTLAAEAGPKEFIWLIQNAAAVCTDSFHATVFSILYHKEFYVLKRFEDSSGDSQNSRLYQILNSFGLADRWVTEELAFQPKERIDFEKVDQCVQAQRSDSEKFLFDALNS